MAVISLLDYEGLAAALVPMSEAQIAHWIEEIAIQAVSYWREIGESEFSRQTGDEYTRAVKLLMVGPERATIGLVGSFPNMLEQGTGPWDLRLTVLRSAKAKIGRNGTRYMAIPFRHGTPGTRGDAGAPMGSQFGDAGAAIGKAVYQRAAKLRNTESGLDAWAAVMRVRLRDPVVAANQAQRLQASSRGTLWGGIPGDGPGPGRLPGGLAAKLRPWHKGDIYAGMYKTRATYAAGRQTGGYMTFRTISTNVQTFRDEKGAKVYRGNKPWVPRKWANWIHPGLRARNLAERVANEIQSQIIPRVVGGGG